eukprot:1258827-Rhodomonas_salina.2
MGAGKAFRRSKEELTEQGKKFGKRFPQRPKEGGGGRDLDCDPPTRTRHDTPRRRGAHRAAETPR